MENNYLTNFGVHELTASEAKETQGGFWGIVLGLFCTYIIVEAALNPEAHIKAFKEGYDLAN